MQRSSRPCALRLPALHPLVWAEAVCGWQIVTLCLRPVQARRSWNCWSATAITPSSVVASAPAVPASCGVSLGRCARWPKSMRASCLRQERAQGYVLSCVSQPVGDVALASLLPAAVASQHCATVSPARRATRTVMRWSLAGAAVAVFSGAWGLTSYTPSQQTAGGATPAPTATPCTVR